ncbi:MAG: cyclase family protein [Chloroflexota bacterium]|jgi:arylformamidase
MIHDVTLPISTDLPVWPGDPKPRLDPVHSLAAGDSTQLSMLQLSTHTGTHLDAPRHLLAEGATVDQLAIDRLVGDAWLCRVPPALSLVDAGTLEEAGIPDGTRRLLLQTTNSGLWDRTPWTFFENYVALAPDGAQWIVDRGIELLGIDYLSIDPFDSEDLPAHRILLTNGVAVLEGLDLRDVEPDRSYYLLCLPLKLLGVDGAPARVLLIDDDSNVSPTRLFGTK